MRLPSLLSAAAIAVFVAIGLGSLRASEAAENFACGPGGRPDASTAICVCPAGKVEKTSGGTSRCVDKPGGSGGTSSKGAGGTSGSGSTTGSGSTSGTGSGSTTGSGTTSGATSGGGSTSGTSGASQKRPAQPKLPSCPASQIATPEGCVDRCEDAELWRDGACVPRCRSDETWTGATCEKHRSHTAVVTCPEGKVADSGAHCCWPGQTWGETSQRCRGKPTCPAGYEARGETCELSECEEGAARAEDGVHCCWPGQEWSRARRACVGVPECPEGARQTDTGCFFDHRCEKGKTPTPSGQCCYKGQTWGIRIDGDMGCAGTPRCPRGLSAHGDDCLRAEDADERDSSELRSTILGAGYFVWEIGGLYQTHSDVTVNETSDGTGVACSVGAANPSCHNHSIALTNLHTVAYSLGLAAHLPSFPLRLHAALEYGGFRGDGVDTISAADQAAGVGTFLPDLSSAYYLGLRLGAAFAPFSLPNLLSSHDSYFNPYAGVDYRLYTTSGIVLGDGSSSTPVSGSSLGLEFGNVFVWRPFTLTLSYVLGLTGPDGHPVSTLMISGGVMYKGLAAH
ncbi:MAG: hypothetical protein ACHREM_02630 [Polyangiales bacterium]